MAVIGDLQTGIETRLATVSAIRANDTAPNLVNARLDKPVAWVELESVSYHETFNGKADFVFVVTLVMPLAAGLERAIDALNPYLDTTGTRSIKVAIEGGRTLGGAADDTTVRTAYDVGLLEAGDYRYAGAKWRIEVTG